MRNLKLAVSIFSGALIILLLTPKISNAAIPCYDCRSCSDALAGNNKNVYLANNITDDLSYDPRNSSACINITGNGNFFDGRGRTIYGLIARPYGILVQGDSSHVHNVTVRNFGNPDATDPSPNNKTPWMNPKTGQVVFRNASDSIAEKVRAYGGRNGIVFYGETQNSSDDNHIIGCYAEGAKWMGMALWYFTTNSTIKTSTAKYNKNGMSLCTAGTDNNEIDLDQVHYSFHWNICICNTAGSHRVKRTNIVDGQYDPNYDNAQDLWGIPATDVDNRYDIRNEIGERATGFGNYCDSDQLLNWNDSDATEGCHADPILPK